MELSFPVTPTVPPRPGGEVPSISIAIFRGYIGVVVIIIGILGNLISVWIFPKFVRRDAAVSQYLFCLSLADLASLLRGLVEWLFTGLADVTGGSLRIDLMSTSLAACKGIEYIGVIAQSLSSYILVVFSFERCLAVIFPLHLNKFVTTTRRAGFLTTLFIWSAIAALPFGIFYELFIPPGTNIPRCWYNMSYKYFDHPRYVFAQLTLSTTIPCILIVVFNAIIVFGIHKSSREISSKSNNQGYAEKRNQRDLRSTLTLVAVSVSFVVFLSPSAITWTFYVSKIYLEKVEPVSLSVALEIGKLTVVLKMVNYGLNFFIYALSLEFFKRELLGIFMCRKMRQFDDTSTRNTKHTICN
jgi:gastrin-releasing peptide receptor